MPTIKPIAAKAIETIPELLVLVLADSKVSLQWEHCSLLLAKAKPEERLKAELSPGGYGIHWPLLDEDLSVQGLLKQAI